jgi:hypothetical protein
LKPLLHCGQTNDFSAENKNENQKIPKFHIQLFKALNYRLSLTIVCSLVNEHACIGRKHLFTDIASSLTSALLRRSPIAPTNNEYFIFATKNRFSSEEQITFS